MKKKRLLPILLVLIAALAVMSLAACVRKKDGNGGGTGGGGGEGENPPPPPPHVHTFSDEWTSVDALHHGHAATCGDTDEVRDLEYHKLNGAKCEKCDYEAESSEPLLEFEAIGDTGYKVTGWKAGVPEEKKAALNIPAEYNSKPVVEIAENAFCLGADGEESVLHDDTLKVVVLPSSIKTIGTNAFAGNSGLTLLPNLTGLDSIGDFAFWDCLAFTEVTVENVGNIGTQAFTGAGLERVTLKNSGTIGNYPFYECNSLKYATIDGYTTLGNYPFYNCPALDTATLLGGFKIIPENMFYNSTNSTNSNIKKIVLGKEFTGESGNSWPKSLEYVEFAEDNKTFTAENGVVYNKEMTEISYVPYRYKGKLIVHDGVTSIARKAFANREFITSITIPSSVTEIGAKPFDECYRLVEVRNFSQVSFADITTGLNDSTKVVTDKSATSSLTDPDENGYVWYEDGGTNYLVAYFGDETDITLPESHDGKTYAVREYAFAYYENDIKSLTVTTGVTALGDCAFTNSILSEKSIEKVVLGEGVTEIGLGCFQWCDNLTDVSLPKSLTKLGAGAFDGCDALEEVKFAGDVSDWAKIELAINTSFDHEKIRLLLNGKDPIPDEVFIKNVDRVGKNAFNSTGVKKVIIGSGVKLVDEDAFYGCEELTTVVLGSEVERFAYGFRQSLSIQKVYYEGTAEKMSTLNQGYGYGGLTAAPELNNGTVYYYEADDPSGKAGNFWHGDVSNPIEW